MEYAVYAADAGVAGWIGPSRAASETPSMRRVRERHGGEAVTPANSPRLAAALARAGAGRVVLSMFAGARMIGLARVSEPIAVPRSEQWLVSHHDARGEPAIRAAPYAIGSHLERRD